MRRKCVYIGSNPNKEESKKMKKRTKFTLRTTIYLTIVGLLALTGVFYAANPGKLATVPKSVAAPDAPDGPSNSLCHCPRGRRRGRCS